MNPSDPFNVCKAVVLVVLYFSVLSCMVCLIESLVHGLNDGVFWYGIGTIATGASLKFLTWKWFGIEG